MATEAREPERPDWLEFVPPGGLWVLGGLVVLLFAQASRQLGADALQVVFLTAGLIAVGVGVMRRLQTGGTAAGDLLTVGVLVRLLVLQGVVLFLMAGSVLPTAGDEGKRALDVMSQPTAPGGGLPEGSRLNPDGTVTPFPWMFYTLAVVFFLNLALVGILGAVILLQWTITSTFVPDEREPGEVQTSTGMILLLAAVAALLGYLGVPPEWDSARMFLCVAALVALVGTMLVVLPVPWRKGLASLLIVLHFGGICTAITAITPPNGPAPWIPSKVWLLFYRPYLQFTYMNNAYHFYSPEPGPATLLKARLEYQGGGYKWFEIPNRAESPVPLYYQRMLSITESINQTQPYLGDWQKKLDSRKAAAQKTGIKMLHPNILAEAMQYREPNPLARRLLASYVRHIANRFPTLKGQPLETIKVYRVTHNIINASALARGVSPTHPTLYLPCYQGEYKPDGTLRSSDRDPFLYWIIPILEDPAAPGGIDDCFDRHAATKWPW